MDFRRFASDMVVRFNRTQADIIRAHSPGRDVIHNFIDRTLAFDHFAVGADLGISSWDSYPRAGGSLAIVRTGDRIRLDTLNGELNLMISTEKLDARMAAPTLPEPEFTRGYCKLHINTVMQADTGADLDFLVGKSSDEVKRESH